MSLANPAVNCFAVYEPRTNLSNVAQRQFALVRGGNSITPYPYPCTSPNNSNLQFTCYPPSRSTILDRLAIVGVNVTLTFSGTPSVGPAPNFNIIQPQYDGFRAWPISSCTNSLNAQINGYGVSIELYTIIHALTRFNQPNDLRNTFLSATLCYDDNCQDYRLVQGSVNNPLGTYSNTVAYPTRGQYPWVAQGAITASSAVVKAKIYEYLCLPPFVFDGNNSGGLTHIDTLTFTYNFRNLQRMWSRCAPLATATGSITNISLNVNIDAATMYLFYITPRITDLIPATIVYPYYQVTNYKTIQTTGANDSNIVVAGGKATIMSNVIQLQSIPSRIIFFVKQNQSLIESNFTTITGCTDSFMQINSIQVNWNNVNGIYSTADPVQIWSTAQQAGLTMSYNEWFGGTNNFNVNGDAVPIALTGGIGCLEPGVSLPLPDDQAPGMLGQYNLQIQVGVTNINPYSISNTVVGDLSNPYQPELNIICIYDGILVISDNSTLAQIGIVSKEDALNAPVRYDITATALENMYGGNFFTKIRDWVKNKAIPFVEKALPIAKQIAPIVAPLVGLGEEGGAVLPRRKLKHRIGRR